MFKKIAILEAEAESTIAASTGNEAAPAVIAPSSDNAGETSSVDWEKESIAMEEGEIADSGATTITDEEVKPPVIETPPAPTVTPSVSAPAAAATPAPAVKTETPPAAPAVAPVATPPVQGKTDAEKEAERVAAEAASQVDEEKLFTGLVDYYKLPEDMQVKLSTEPENVLPFMAARLHQTISKQLVKTIAELLPQTIISMREGQQKEDAAKTAFYTRWPNLKDKEKEVLQAGVLFRQLNPTATAEEAIERIGATVCAAFGIAVQNTEAAPAAPAAPKPAVFTPTGGGGVASVATKTPSSNMFTNLAEEILQEES